MCLNISYPLSCPFIARLFVHSSDYPSVRASVRPFIRLPAFPSAPQSEGPSVRRLIHSAVHPLLHLTHVQSFAAVRHSVSLSAVCRPVLLSLHRSVVLSSLYTVNGRLGSCLLNHGEKLERQSHEDMHMEAVMDATEDSEVSSG